MGDEAYRAMTPAPSDGLPSLGRTARKLGIRIPDDVKPTLEGLVLPGTGGMSVATGSPWNLPAHRRPRSMGKCSTGPDGDSVYAIEIPLDRTLNLWARPTPPEGHAEVEPMEAVPLSEYEANLAATRPAWRRVWPNH